MKFLSSSLKSWTSTFFFGALGGAFFIFMPMTWADFTDLPHTDKNFVAVNTLVEKKMIKGVGGNHFGPNQALDRAQAVTLMLRYGGHELSEKPQTTSAFIDVNPAHWYAAPVEQALKLNIVKGNPDGSFEPSKEVTRAAFLTLITRADGVDLTPFEKGGEWHAAVMAYAKSAGLNVNDEGPGQILSRQEAAEILYLSLLLREKGDSPFLAAQAQRHLSHVESSVTANQLSSAQYHAALAEGLMTQVRLNLPEDKRMAAEKKIAQAYLAWVESIFSTLEENHTLSLERINQTLQLATEAYFEDSSIQSLAAHLKDIGCEIYDQLPESRGEIPEDCVKRLAQ